MCAFGVKMRSVLARVHGAYLNGRIYFSLVAALPDVVDEQKLSSVMISE
jgi:hypothetical protein